MLPSQLNGSPKRGSPFGRAAPSASPPKLSRPKSAFMGPLGNRDEPSGHFRNNSTSQMSSIEPRAFPRERASPSKNNVSSGTFAPEFIKTEELRKGADQIRGLEGDNDFSGNKYVWLKDPEKAFVRGLILEEHDDGTLLVQSDDGDVSIIES